MIALEAIAAEVSSLAAKIDAPSDSLPTYGSSEDGAHPHIEVDDRGMMHYVIVERGVERSRYSTKKLDELLQRVFGDVSFGMACDYELKNRIPNQDFRRILFREQTRILGILSEKWAADNENRISEILKRSPYDDLSDKRVEYCKSLRRSGCSEAEIWRLACEKYPEPTPARDS